MNSLETRNKLMESTVDQLTKDVLVVEEKTAQGEKTIKTKTEAIQNLVFELIDDIIDTGALRTSKNLNTIRTIRRNLVIEITREDL